MALIEDIPADIIRLIPTYIPSVDQNMFRGACKDLYYIIPAVKCDQMSVAAAAGYIGIITYLVDSGQKMSEKTTMYAAAGGHLSCLKYLIDRGCPVNDYAAMAAVKNGHLECMKYILYTTTAHDPHALTRAAANGHVHILQYLRDFKINIACWKYAAQYGHINVIEWLKSTAFPIDYHDYEYVMSYATISKRIDVLEVLMTCGFPLTDHTMFEACSRGHLEIAKWLYLHKCPRTAPALRAAVANGHTDVCRWLIDKGFDNTAGTYRPVPPLNWSQQGPEDWETFIQ